MEIVAAEKNYYERDVSKRREWMVPWMDDRFYTSFSYVQVISDSVVQNF